MLNSKVLLLVFLNITFLYNNYRKFNLPKFNHNNITKMIDFQKKFDKAQDPDEFKKVIGKNVYNLLVFFDYYEPFPVTEVNLNYYKDSEVNLALKKKNYSFLIKKIKIRYFFRLNLFV